jgi:hypothetical protein
LTLLRCFSDRPAIWLAQVTSYLGAIGLGILAAEAAAAGGAEMELS